MVFFVCEGCNETLKKNKVDQHAARCRNCWAVSCVDCSVVFKGNDYAAHTSCISEAQKYQGALYKGKAKKQSPQERWMDVVQNADSDDPKVQNVLSRIASYDNVPRKKAKFLNFMKNSIAMHDANMIEKVWTLFDEAFNASQASSEQACTAAPSTETSSTADSTPAVSTEANSENNKRKEVEEKTETSNKKQKKASKEIKWSKVIKSALKKTTTKSMELEELKDQVLVTLLKEDPTRDEKELKKELKNALKTLSDSKFETVEVIKLIK